MGARLDFRQITDYRLQLAARRIGITESGRDLVVALQLAARSSQLAGSAPQSQAGTLLLLCSSQLALAARSIGPIDQVGGKSCFAACSCRKLPEGVVKHRLRPIHSSLCTLALSSCTFVALLARGIYWSYLLFLA